MRRTSRSNGEPVHIDSAATAYRLGLRFIHQEFNVVPTLSVAENIFMGRPYPRRAGLFIGWRHLNAQARHALARLGIDHIDPRTKLGELTLGDQMLVRISAALLDERTALCHGRTDGSADPRRERTPVCRAARNSCLRQFRFSTSRIASMRSWRFATAPPCCATASRSIAGAWPTSPMTIWFR